RQLGMLRDGGLGRASSRIRHEELMADEKETGFKVSDRRMFNPDGSLRQPDSETEEDKLEPAAPSLPDKDAPAKSDKVISFPAELERKGQLTGQGHPAQRAAAPAAKPAGAPNPSQPLRDVSPGRTQAPEYDTFPEASFTGLVNMLAVEAVMHLGLIE